MAIPGSDATIIKQIRKYPLLTKSSSCGLSFCPIVVYVGFLQLAPQLVPWMKRMWLERLWMVAVLVVAGLLHGLGPTLTSEVQQPLALATPSEGRKRLQLGFQKVSIRGPSMAVPSAKREPGNMLAFFRHHLSL